MGIVGDHPESGVRIALERPRLPEEAPWVYAGEASIPDAIFPLRVTVAAGGDVTVGLEASAAGVTPPADLAEKIRLIVRTAYRQATADGEPPARRIVRWRGEK